MKKILCLVMVCVMLLGMCPAADAAGSVDSFADVQPDSWYAKAVQYVKDNDQMIGVSANAFQPEGVTTRAMVVTVLHRMAGKPAATGTGFTDVENGAWYTEAILWAQGNGIVEGYGDGTFHPGASMTREEMMAVFHRYSKHKGYNVAKTASMRIYTDSVKIQSYAEDAMSWAVSVGLIKGFPDGTIRPQDKSNRAQLATVLMRFADINAIPDNGNDEEDNVVTDKDMAVLTASKNEVLANTNTDVVFYVNSTLTVSSFELYKNGQSTGIYLYDDGNYAKNSDDIPNDGCYTGVLRLNHAAEEDVIFTARAAVGDSHIITNERAVFVYYELTDAQIDQMDAVEAEAAAVVTNAWASAGDTDPAAVIASIRSGVENCLKPYINAGLVSDLVYHEEGWCYTWNYPQFGVDTMLKIYAGQSAGDDIKRSGAMRSQLVTGIGTDSTAASPVSVDLGVTYRVGKVVILNAFGANNAWSSDYNAVGRKLEKAGFEVTYVYDFECSDFMDLEDYNAMILVNSHGNTYWGVPGSKPMICTEEAQTKAKNKTYSADLKKNRIEKVTLDNGDKVYWIAPELFRDYYTEEKLESPIVHLGICRGYPENNSKMVDALVDVGASAVCAYNASVYTSYDVPMINTIVDRLVAGDEIETAVQKAKTAHGNQDPTKDTDWFWNRHAQMQIYGDEGAHIYNKLGNGNFDNSFGLLFSSVFGWEDYGDSRSIFRLAGLKPVSAPRMAIISSGFGSMGNETTSSIYQTFLVPEGAKTIEFCYNVVSEEPMEFVGSSYNDIFQADLLDTKGNVLKNLAFESVNTSTWYAIDGINFPGGDDTAYHTRWQKISSDVLTPYQGQLVVIRFVVKDAGDSSYDTAALIDSVIVK